MLQKNRISHYKLVKVLGKGGFGTTFLAKDLHLPENCKCAIKRLNPNIQNKEFLPVALRLFNTEAKTLQKLGEHPQIPKLLNYFSKDKIFYLVQELIEGETLNKEFVEGETWSEEKVIQLLEDCLNILKFIHDRNVIHRDIKPDNLIRRPEDGRLVLIDFGAVKQLISQTQVVSSVAIGTKGYIAPEQAVGKPRFSSDIYALGTIAIQALTGIKPKEFKRDDNGKIIWPDRTKNINPKLFKIINKMTEFHFRNRYDRAELVLQDLRSLNDNIFISYSKQILAGIKTVKPNLAKIKLPKYPSKGRISYKTKFKLISIASILFLAAIAWRETNFEGDRQQQQVDSLVSRSYLDLKNNL